MVVVTVSGKAALDNLITKALEEQKLPSLVFGVTSVDNEIYFNAGGDNVFNNPTSGPVKEDSVFWIASMTKLVVHLAALKLVEEGRLKLESPVSDYIPELAKLILVNKQGTEQPYEPAKTVMRVKHLLNHSSGLEYPYGPMDEQSAPYATPHDMENPIPQFFSLVKGDLPGIPVQFEPGESFAYGWSSDTLGFVIERATGQTLETYVQENIFKPLGIKASFYLTPDLEEKLVEVAHRREGKLHPWRGRSVLFERDPTKVSRHHGGDGLFISLKDFLGLLRHILQIHVGQAENPIFSANLIQSLFHPSLNDAGAKAITSFMQWQPFVPKTAFQWGNAFALSSEDWPSKRKKGSGFWSGFAGTFFWIDPTSGIAAVCGTQLLPCLDKELMQLTSELEDLLYAGLTEKSG